MGFCMGVRLAMQAMEELIKSDTPRPIHTYGPLIHNQRVLDGLAERGVGRIDRVDEASKGTVVLRTHGVRPQEKQALIDAGVRVVDLTCPRVVTSQKAVASAVEKGFQVILVGDRNHGEIIALEGFAPGCEIIGTTEEAERVVMKGPAHVVGQTTLLRDDFLAISLILKKRNPLAQTALTLCPATVQRQNALLELSRAVEALLVIGGRNSANTGKLYQQALHTGIPAWHIEGAADLGADVFGFSRVGITAGASTPDWIVEEVEAALRRGGRNV